MLAKIMEESLNSFLLALEAEAMMVKVLLNSRIACSAQ